MYQRMPRATGRHHSRHDRTGVACRTGSPLKGKIAMDKVAVMGQSCGGFLSIALGADSRARTIGVFNPGVQPSPAAQAQSRATPGARHNAGKNCRLCTDANWDVPLKGIKE
jgi:hypothetical protein